MACRILTPALVVVPDDLVLESRQDVVHLEDHVRVRVAGAGAAHAPDREGAAVYMPCTQVSQRRTLRARVGWVRGWARGG